MKRCWPFGVMLIEYVATWGESDRNQITQHRVLRGMEERIAFLVCFQEKFDADSENNKLTGMTSKQLIKFIFD